MTRRYLIAAAAALATLSGTASAQVRPRLLPGHPAYDLKAGDPLPRDHRLLQLNLPETEAEGSKLQIERGAFRASLNPINQKIRVRLRF